MMYYYILILFKNFNYFMGIETYMGAFLGDYCNNF